MEDVLPARRFRRPDPAQPGEQRRLGRDAFPRPADEVVDEPGGVNPGSSSADPTSRSESPSDRRLSMWKMRRMSSSEYSR